MLNMNNSLSDLQENPNFTKQIKPKQAYLAAPGNKWLLRHIEKSQAKYGLSPNNEIYLYSADFEGSGTLEMLKKFKKCYQVHNWKIKQRLDISLKLNQREIIKCLTDENNNLFEDLERLKIFSDYNPTMRNKDLEFFSNHLFPQLKSLRKLDLGLSMCESITDEGLKLFGAGISRLLPNLTSLQISINNSPTNDRGLEDLASQICRYLPKMKVFSLNFTRCRSITNEGIKAISSLICNRLVDLQHLELFFIASHGITDHGLHILIANISNSLTYLKNLSLKFWENPAISDPGLEGLEHLLKSHSSKLSQLTLEFPGCPNITDKTLESVISSIMIYQSNLDVLGLYFSGCSLVTDKSLALLDLTRLPRLTHLLLSFLDLENITEETFQSITLKALNTQLNLQKLQLNFIWYVLQPYWKHDNLNSCINITDKSMETLGSLFKDSLVQLNSADLFFSMCKKITNQGFDVLVSSIRHLKHLKSTFLQFNRCEVTADRKAITEKLLDYVPKVYVCVE